MPFALTKNRPAAQTWIWIRRVACCSIPCLFLASAQAQYPGHVDKNKQPQAPEPRATAILEWTGQPGKPSASRIVPIVIFDGATYQPGGLYLAQPEPLAVEAGTEYVLEKAGQPQGIFDIFSAQNMQGAWFGYGVWKPWTAPLPSKPKLKSARYPPQVVKDAGSDRPTLRKKGDDADARSGSSSSTPSSTSPSSSSPTGQSSSSKPPDSGATSDSDRPTLHRRDDSGATDSTAGGQNSQGAQTQGAQTQGTQAKTSDSTQGKNGSQTSDSSQTTTDPDRPTLHRRDDADTGASTGSGTGSVDPDRPKMHKPAAAAAPDASPDVPVSAAASSDPDRPHLQRGRPKDLDTTLEPTRLSGTPADLQQMVAVSDSKSREPHSFAFQWSDPADAAKMQAALEDIARKALLPSLPATSPSKSTPARRTAAAARRSRIAAAAPPIPLTDEKFQAYELSFSGGATVVFSAKLTSDSPASNADNSAAAPPARYITLIAQPDFYGVPQVLLKSVTADNRLDATPRMRLVDAADTDGDNRAELIFELRSKTDRQFAIYKVAHGRAEQVFSTGSVP